MHQVLLCMYYNLLLVCVLFCAPNKTKRFLKDIHILFSIPYSIMLAKKQKP